jgi:hypothetical protein
MRGNQTTGRPFRDGADAMAAITTVAVDLVVERYSTEPLSLLGGLHHQYVRI